MTYDKVQLISRIILPMIAFLVAAVATLLLLLSAHTKIWILFAGPPAMGICGGIIVFALATPFNDWFLTRELKLGNTGERLAAWFSENPKQEFYVGPNGAWLDGQKYYWGHSLFLTIEDASLKRTPAGTELIIKCGETLDKSTHCFSLEIPVPPGHESEAENVVLGILNANIILDENRNRKSSVQYIEHTPNGNPT